GIEYVVRGLGFIKGIEDIEDIVISAQKGTPITIKDVAQVVLGADFRRGALDKEGREVTGGVILMRFGENPLKVIERIKDKISEISVGLPEGVKIVGFYDRTGLITRSINTLKGALIQEVFITVFVILIFLLHFWGSVVIAIVLPVGVLIAFILMQQFGIDANIMSLGGIAIAIGVMVDSGCVIVENIYSKLAARGGDLSNDERVNICVEAASEVGRPVLFALLTTIVSFIPVFVLTGQAGKLFSPLAFTKTFAMVGAAIIALTLLPTLAFFALRGKLKPVEENKAARFLHQNYRPLLNRSLKNKKVIVIIALIVLVVGLGAGVLMKQEFMPPLNEGDLLFMPVFLPGASLTT
ncbi:MAG: efflux RND transporter permease subunit, partial [Candidatus Omnitrophica bacterium]|nr:efflux RND transporter permease subunit [Candidatus Omnitrophota bacterium]